MSPHLTSKLSDELGKARDVWPRINLIVLRHISRASLVKCADDRLCQRWRACGRDDDCHVVVVDAYHAAPPCGIMLVVLFHLTACQRSFLSSIHTIAKLFTLAYWVIALPYLRFLVTLHRLSRYRKRPQRQTLIRSSSLQPVSRTMAVMRLIGI